MGQIIFLQIFETLLESLKDETQKENKNKVKYLNPLLYLDPMVIKKSKEPPNTSIFNHGMIMYEQSPWKQWPFVYILTQIWNL